MRDLAALFNMHDWGMVLFSANYFSPHRHQQRVARALKVFVSSDLLTRAFDDKVLNVARDALTFRRVSNGETELSSWQVRNF